MHHRFIASALILATMSALLLVTVIQPREAALRKKKLKDMREFLLAQSNPACTLAQYQCSMGNQAQCAWYADNCTGQSSEGGSESSGGGGGSLSGSGSSGGGQTVNSISAREKERITTECLEYLTQPPSGYAEVKREYGLFNNIFDLAVNACENAYLSAQGKFGNSDLYLVYDLLLGNKSPIGLLYQAFQKTPAPLKGQSVADYIDVNKEGAAKYLKCLATSMSAFAGTTSVTANYLTNPLPYVTAKNAAEYNKNNAPAIKSVEEELAACMPAEPKKEEVAVKKEEQAPQAKPTPQQAVIEPAPQVKTAEPETISAQQRVQDLIMRMFNKLRGIREALTGIARKKISSDIGIQKRNFEKQVRIIETFTLCKEKGIC